MIYWSVIEYTVDETESSSSQLEISIAINLLYRSICRSTACASVRKVRLGPSNDPYERTFLKFEFESNLKSAPVRTS